MEQTISREKWFKEVKQKKWWKYKRNLVIDMYITDEQFRINNHISLEKYKKIKLWLLILEQLIWILLIIGIFIPIFFIITIAIVLFENNIRILIYKYILEL